MKVPREWLENDTHPADDPLMLGWGNDTGQIRYEKLAEASAHLGLRARFVETMQNALMLEDFGVASEMRQTGFDLMIIALTVMVEVEYSESLSEAVCDWLSLWTIEDMGKISGLISIVNNKHSTENEIREYMRREV